MDTSTPTQQKQKTDDVPAAGKKKGKEQSAVESLKEDASPVVSMFKRLVPPQLLELGPWLSRMMEKYTPNLKQAATSTVERWLPSAARKAPIEIDRQGYLPWCWRKLSFRADQHRRQAVLLCERWGQWG